MKNNWKRLLSLALALVMVIGLMPVFGTQAAAASAEDTYTAAVPGEDTYAPTVADEYFYVYGAESGDFYDFWNVVRERSGDDNAQSMIRLDVDVTLNPDVENDSKRYIRLYVEYDENIILDLNGHTLKRNTSGWVSNGQVFRLMDDAKLTILNGTITGGYNDGNGGAFYMDEDAQLTLTGVTVTGNRCLENGAAIYAIDDTVVTINGGSVIRNNSAGYDESEAGAAIYCDYDASLIIDGATVRNNTSAYGYAGGIFWGANGVCRLIDATIEGNQAHTTAAGIYVPAGVYDTDIYLGGVTVIDNNYLEKQRVHDEHGEPSNLYLLDEDAEINNYTGKPLAEGSRIGITVGNIDSSKNDCITTKTSKFTEAQLGYFSYDNSEENGNILRKVDQGTGAGDNRWALYATSPKSAEYQIPAITDTMLRSEFASDVATVIDAENRTVTLTLNNDILTKRFISLAAIRDFVSFSYTYAGTKMQGEEVVYNFVTNPTVTYTIKTPNNTFEYWTINIEAIGEWPEDPAVAMVNGQYYTEFDAAWRAATDALETGDSELILLADWLAGDANNNSLIDHNETAGNFSGKAGGYFKGALAFATANTLTIDLNGHKIDRMRSSLSAVEYGSVITVTVGSLVVKDSVGEGKITGGNTTGNGGGILMQGGTLTVEANAEISGNKAVNGGGIYMAVGTLTMNGNVTKNQATNGGGIYMGNATVAMDGTVSHNTATNGAGIYVAGGTLTLTSGNVIGNTASSGGGGVYIAAGTVNVEGATISGNTASFGGGIRQENGTLNMKDGYITSNTATSNLIGGAGVSSYNGTFNLSGGTISLNSTYGHGGGVALYNTPDFNMTGGVIMGNQGSQGAGVYWNSTGTATLRGGSITSNPNGFWVANANSKVMLGGDIKIIENANYNLYLASNQADLYHDTEHPLTTGAEISVYMTETQVGSDNEDKISAANNGFVEKSYLYFTADDPNYRIANREKANPSGEADRWQLHLVKVGTSADERPTITAAKVADTYYLAEAEIDTTHNVITLPVNNDEAGANKVALEEMSLYLLADFTFVTEGTEIIGGDVKRDFVKNSTDVFVVKTPNGTYDYWTIRVIPNTPWGTDAVIARVYLDGEESYTEFTSGNPTGEDPNKGFAAAWKLALDNPGSTMQLYANWLAGDANNNGVIDTTETAGKFTGDGSNQGALYLNDANIDVTVDLNGFTIDRGLANSSSTGVVFWIKAGQLTIEDSYKGGNITGGNYSTGGAFLIDGANAKLVLNGGTISGNRASAHGAAIYAYNNASVTINGGTIANNTAAQDGGAIRLDNATLTMNGGTISGNSAVSGGGVYLYSGTFTMNGGTIEGNNAENGAGVYLFNGTFNFHNGYIQNNTASGHGGGVYVYNKGRMMSTGGQIQNNTAAGNGGGIALESPNAMATQLENTFLIGNSAKRGGGIALFQSGSSSTITHTFRNLVIHGNSATERGGGMDVDIFTKQNLLVFGGNILENTAPNGGGIYYANGALSLNGTSVTANTAATKGGGVFVNGADDEDILLGGSIVIRDNKLESGAASNLHLDSADNNIYPMLTDPFTEETYIGISAGYSGTDLISGTDSGFGIADGYYFHADNSEYYDIGLVDSGSDGFGRFRIYLAQRSESGYNPGITDAEPKYASFAGSDTFIEIDTENRIAKLTVNNTYKDIFSNMSLDTLATIITTEDSLIDKNVLAAAQNFVDNPSGIYQVIEEDDFGPDGYDGWYNLWTIEIVPAGGAWSDVAGSVASVTTPVGTQHFYDMEMAYAYALTNAAYPGGATLKLNQDWYPTDGVNFDYDKGTDNGRLYLNNSAYNLTIDLNGFTIGRTLGSSVSHGQIFRLEKGNLTIQDTSEAQTGKITGANNDGDGGAFYVTGGSLTIEGGSIEHNSAECGGGIFITNSAVLTMNGGKICFNNANGDDSDHGGAGVYLDEAAVFTMNGGEISSNEARMYGGGIYAEDEAVFTMNGGAIRSNAAQKNGGGLHGADYGDGVMITINGGEISDNQAVNGGGLYWEADDDAKLYLNGGSIVRNSSGTGHGGGVYVETSARYPYVGGDLRVVDNTDNSGSTPVRSNLYLESSYSLLRQNTGHKLSDGAQIGIRFGYNTDSDYFTASESYFDANSIEYFSADDPAYFVRMVVVGSSGNTYRLYLTKTSSGSAANSRADIVGASVKAEFASPIAPVFENNVAQIPVNADLYLEMISGNYSMNDVLHGKLTVSSGAAILDETPLAQATDLTTGVNIKIKAADGVTVMTWRVKVVPGSESGTWNQYQVALNDAAFAGESDGQYYPGEIVYIQPVDRPLSAFKAWSAVDMNNEMTTVDGVTSFVMPANDVEITGLYYTEVDTVALELSAEPVTAFHGTADYTINGSVEGVGRVVINWMIGEEYRVGMFAFNTTYTAEVRIDLSDEEDYYFTETPTATINGVEAEVVCEEGNEAIVIRLDLQTRKAKVVEPILTYSAYSANVPGATPEEDDTAYVERILEELRTNHSMIPVITEDNDVTTIKVDWTEFVGYTNDNDQHPYVEVAGVVRAEENPNLDMTDYEVTALVYGTLIVSDPVITVEADPDNDRQAIVTIACDTIGATVKYTVSDDDPHSSTTQFITTETNNSFSFYVGVPKGSRTTIAVKAVATKEDCIDSNIIPAAKTFHSSYGLTVNGENVANYAITGNDGLYAGESTVITVTPAEGYWISSMTAGAYGSSTNSDTIVVTNPTSDVVVDVVCQPVIERIELNQLTLTAGQAFPTLNEVRAGYTVTVDWNTNDTVADYGATYYPTILVEATSSIYPFAEGFVVTMGGEEVYVSESTASLQSFKLTMSTPNAMLTAVVVPEDLTIAQGTVLNLPLTVEVTVDGDVITAANVSWTCADFDADVPGTYTFIGVLALPANVEISETAEGFNGEENTIEITVTVEAQEQLTAPTAESYLDDITKVVDDKTLTIRATVVELITEAAGATIYYVIDSTPDDSSDDVDLLDDEGNLTEDATAYDPTAPIVLDTAGMYTITAVVVKENYITSEVAEFTFDVSARQFNVVRVCTMIDGTTALIETFNVLEGEPVTVNAADYIDSFARWDVIGITLTEEEATNPILTFNMPANAVAVTATSAAAPVAPEVEIAGTTMTLGNDLALNFMILKSAVTGEGWYAEVAHGDKITTIEQSEWITAGDYIRIAYNGLAAKAMVDEVTITIYDAEGNALTSKTDSIRAYAMRMFDSKNGTDALKVALVDMLNYGAAAQIYFNYKSDDLANNLLTDEQKALASQTVAMEDQRVKSDRYAGTTLSLEENIVLNFYFDSSLVGQEATVTYTDHYGVAQTFYVKAAANGRYAKVVVDQLVVADANVLVSVTIDGETAVDSVSGYCARMAEELELSEPLMKFATSAKAYFSAN